MVLLALSKRFGAVRMLHNATLVETVPPADSRLEAQNFTFGMTSTTFGNMSRPLFVAQNYSLVRPRGACWDGAAGHVVVEFQDPAAACRALFAGIPNVTLLEGDWRAIEAHAPFDLLVLDGGGGGKGAGKAAADPARLLTPGGSIVLDDMHPPLRYWPEESGRELDAHGHAVVEGRAYWLNRPDVFASEVRVHPQVSTLIATLKAPKPGG